MSTSAAHIMHINRRIGSWVVRNAHIPRAHCSYSRSFTTASNSQTVDNFKQSSDSSNNQSNQQSQSGNKRSRFLFYLVPASLVGAYCLYTMTESPRKMVAAFKAAQGYHETILNTKFDAPTLSESAPDWLRALAVDESFTYKDVEAVFPVEDHLIYDALQQEDCVTEYYHFLENTKETDQCPEIRVVFHLGSRLCGHRGIVHGGLTATLIDQVSGECAFLANGPGLFTANLNVNYTAPLIAGKHVLVSAKITSQQGRKTVVSVKVTDGGDVEFAHANVLYVRPKWIPENAKREGLIRAEEVPQPQPSASASN